MANTSKTLLSALVIVALAMAGCSDDGGSSTPEPTATSDEPAPTSGNTTAPPPMPEEGPETMYINETVSGLVDCLLASNNAPINQGGYSGTVTSDMIGASYELTKVGTASGTLCIYFDDGSTETSGIIPETVTSFMIYADQAPAPIEFSFAYTPAA